MKQIQLQMFLCIALSIICLSCHANIKDYLNCLTPTELKKTLIQKYPLASTVVNEVIENYLTNETEYILQSNWRKNCYNRALLCYRIMNGAFCFMYLSNKTENFFYNSIISLAIYGSIYANNKDMKYIANFLPYLLTPTQSYGEQQSSGYASMFFSLPFYYVRMTSDNECTYLNIPIQLIGYGANAYIHYILMARDNRTWSNYLKNFCLAVFAHQVITLSAVFSYKAYKASYYRWFASNTQLARRALIDESRNNLYLDNNSITSTLQKFAENKECLTKKEKLAILNSPYQRYDNFEHYLNISESFPSRIILNYLKDN